MAYSWKILKAAVEQAILFPSMQNAKEYVDKLMQKGVPYEIVSKTPNDDGTITIVMRKGYNNNAFLSSADELLP